jgi:opacity protein-like surface antigen
MKKTLIALTLAAVLPLSAQAAERSYTYVEGTYNNLDGDIDGFGLRGSVEFADSGFYALGQYQNFSERGFDADFFELGLGYALNLSDNVDLIAEAAHVDFDIADGYRVSAGVRGNFTENLEGLFKANYRNVDGFGDGDFTGTAGLQYKFSPTWGVTGEVEFDDGGESYLLGLRASF